MGYVLEQVGHQLSVQVDGEIDLVNAPRLAEILELVRRHAREAGDVTEIVVDLRPGVFLSAAGLTELVDAHRRCRDDAVLLCLVVEHGVVLRSLRVTGLDRTLNVRVDPGPRPPSGQRARTPEDLVNAVAHGDERAFGLLYDRLAPAVLGTVRSVVPDPARSEEITREVFVELWRTAARAGPRRCGVVTWAMTVAHRRAVDWVRLARFAGEHPTTGDTPDRVVHGLAELTESERTSILLAYYEGRTYRELATTLGISPDTVLHGLRGGLRRLGAGRDVTAPDTAPDTALDTALDTAVERRAIG